MSEQRFGILIASSQYQDPKLESLRFPENDVDGLNEILSSKDCGNFTEISVLKNKPHYEVLLKIHQILKKAKKDDLVLIYYSGHGKLNAAGKLHLATTDTIVDSMEATSIPVDSIKSYMDISTANKFVLILDSCFSGAAGSSFTKGGVDDQLQLASGGRGTYIMTGSTAIQVASEKEGDSFGVFTKHIIEGIKNGDAADDDGLVTMDRLYNYVHDHVLKESLQEPMKWNLNVKGDLVISGGGKSKRAEQAKQIRAMLLDLASKNLLPDYVLSSSLKIIKSKPQQLNYEERQHDDLINKLFKKEIELNCFIEEWVNTGKEGAAAGPKIETQTPIKNQDNEADFKLTEERKMFGILRTVYSWIYINKFNLIKIYIVSSWTVIIGLGALDQDGLIKSIGGWLFLISFAYLLMCGLVLAVVSYRHKDYQGLHLAALAPINILCFILSIILLDAFGINSNSFWVALAWGSFYAIALLIMWKKDPYIKQYFSHFKGQ